MRTDTPLPGTTDSDRFYQCPECGFKQQSDAETRVRCHRCGRSYAPGKAKKVKKQPDPEKGDGFFRYTAAGG